MISSVKNKLISIGIDVGSVNGAISVIDEDGKILVLTKAPVYQTEIKSKRNKSKLNRKTGKYEADFKKRTWINFKELKSIFDPYVRESIIYTIERIQYRPMEGETSSFKNGNSLGIFQGLYPYLDPIAYYEPLPSEWKHEFGLSSIKDDSNKMAEQIYGINLRDYLPKGKTDDLAEALLLSFYGLQQYYKKEK